MTTRSGIAGRGVQCRRRQLTDKKIENERKFVECSGMLREICQNGRKSATEMRTKLLEATSRKFQNALKERKKQKKKKKTFKYIQK